MLVHPWPRWRRDPGDSGEKRSERCWNVTSLKVLQGDVGGQGGSNTLPLYVSRKNVDVIYMCLMASGSARASCTSCCSLLTSICRAPDPHIDPIYLCVTPINPFPISCWWKSPQPWGQFTGLCMAVSSGLMPFCISVPSALLGCPLCSSPSWASLHSSIPPSLPVMDCTQKHHVTFAERISGYRDWKQNTCYILNVVYFIIDCCYRHLSGESTGIAAA